MESLDLILITIYCASITIKIQHQAYHLIITITPSTRHIATMTMTSTHLLLLSCVLLTRVLANPLPSGCKHAASPSLELDCTYGTTKDSCGNDQCMKGPGEMCGGKFGR